MGARNLMVQRSLVIPGERYRISPPIVIPGERYKASRGKGTQVAVPRQSRTPGFPTPRHFMARPGLTIEGDAEVHATGMTMVRSP